jgi:hypothetical protein
MKTSRCTETERTLQEPDGFGRVFLRLVLKVRNKELCTDVETKSDANTSLGMYVLQNVVHLFAVSYV